MSFCHRQQKVSTVTFETDGSTYRKPGALVVLDTRGARVGALSGGCLEGELEVAARYVMASGIAGDMRFDTSGDNDRLFGSGIGCGGSTRVMLLPLLTRAAPVREALLDAYERGRRARFAEGCGIDRIHVTALDSVLECAHFDAALVMNHNYLLDGSSLMHLSRRFRTNCRAPAARLDTLPNLGPIKVLFPGTN
jgi:xanthine/CO dehydrogenase XdhC/CoxF family maturation factor